MRVQSSQRYGIYGFCNKVNMVLMVWGIYYIYSICLHIWVLEPFGSKCNASFGRVLCSEEPRALSHWLARSHAAAVAFSVSYEP